jgi:hypothetical protein
MARRLFLALAAAAAFAASAAVFVVALAFALYALAQPFVGRAGAAAIVAGVAALIIGLSALFMGFASKGKRSKAAPPSKAMDRVIRFVREKPVVAISAALGAGFLAVRNPLYLGAALRAFFEGRELPRR